MKSAFVLCEGVIELSKSIYNQSTTILSIVLLGIPDIPDVAGYTVQTKASQGICAGS